MPRFVRLYEERVAERVGDFPQVLDPLAGNVDLAVPAELLDLMENAVVVMAARVVRARRLKAFTGINLVEYLAPAIGLPDVRQRVVEQVADGVFRVAVRVRAQ